MKQSELIERVARKGTMSKVEARRIAPEFLAHPLVQVLGESLGQTVAQGLQQDRAVVVVARLEGRGPGQDPRPPVVGVELDVVAHGVGRPEADDPARPVGSADATAPSLCYQQKIGPGAPERGLRGIPDVVLDIVYSRHERD